MNQLALNADGLTGRRLPFFLRFFLAIVAGLLITTIGEPQTFTELVKLPGFMTAFFTSIGIAIIAVEQVSYSTLVVHRRYPWYDTSYIKMSWQIVTCFLMPFLTIFLLASGYYAYHGHFILDTDWTIMYGWQIFFMLLALNLVFTMVQIELKLPPGTPDLLQHTPEVVATISEFSPTAPEIPSVIPEPLPVLITTLGIIVFVFHYNGNNKVYYSDGSYLMDTRSLKVLYKLLDPGLYRMNPKKSIIRLDNTRSFIENPDGSLKIELIIPNGMVTQVSKIHKRAYLGYY